MPIASEKRRIGRSIRLATLLATAMLVPASLVLAACGRSESPISPTTPSATATSSASPADSASPDLSASPDADGTASPGSSPGAGVSASPGASGSPTGAASDAVTVAPATCTTVTPVKVERAAVEPRRATEVVTVVSDGRTLTPGTREQTDFTTAALVSPDGTTSIDDDATLATIAKMVAKSTKHTVLLSRPEAPDADIDAAKRPFNSTGTFVLYRASGLLTAEVVVECSDQQQRWRFTSEGDPALGTLNCAVEPPRGNALARQVYGAFC